MTPRREELAEGVTVWLGDAREVCLGRAAVVITDPPYGISHSSNHGASWQGTQIASDQDTSVRDQVLAPFEHVAAFGTWKTPPIDRTKGTLVWDKGPAFGMGDLKFPWKGSFELIYVRGDIWRGSRDEGVLRGHIQVSWESKGRCHPHQKPVSLITALLEKVPTGRTIADPFLGSGTTGVAAVQRGFPFVGVEIDPVHFSTACRRISEALKSPSLFVPAPAPVKQETFDLGGVA